MYCKFCGLGGGDRPGKFRRNVAVRIVTGSFCIERIARP